MSKMPLKADGFASETAGEVYRIRLYCAYPQTPSKMNGFAYKFDGFESNSGADPQDPSKMSDFPQKMGGGWPGFVAESARSVQKERFFLGN